MTIDDDALESDTGDLFEEGRTYPFAQVGEWVLLADIPAQAKAVYSLMRAHINVTRGDGEVWPARKALSFFMGWSQEASVDPYIKALVTIDAVAVRQQRYRNGMRVRNVYTVHLAPPPGYSGPTTLKEGYKLYDAELARQEAELEAKKAKRKAKAKAKADAKAKAKADAEAAARPGIGSSQCPGVGSTPCPGIGHSQCPGVGSTPCRGMGPTPWELHEGELHEVELDELPPPPPPTPPGTSSAPRADAPPKRRRRRAEKASPTTPPTPEPAAPPAAPGVTAVPEPQPGTAVTHGVATPQPPAEGDPAWTHADVFLDELHERFRGKGRGCRPATYEELRTWIAGFLAGGADPGRLRTELTVKMDTADVPLATALSRFRDGTVQLRRVMPRTAPKQPRPAAPAGMTAFGEVIEDVIQPPDREWLRTRPRRMQDTLARQSPAVAQMLAEIRSEEAASA